MRENFRAKLLPLLNPAALIWTYPFGMGIALHQLWRGLPCRIPRAPSPTTPALWLRDQRRTPFLVFASFVVFARFLAFVGFADFAVFATSTARAAHWPSMTASSSTPIGTL